MELKGDKAITGVKKVTYLPTKIEGEKVTTYIRPNVILIIYFVRVCVLYIIYLLHRIGGGAHLFMRS